jgi:hypothetical protein
VVLVAQGGLDGGEVHGGMVPRAYALLGMSRENKQRQ